MSILKPGLFTTIQDLGRIGCQKFGVIVSGAMDALSYRIGEILLKQKPSAAIEFTLIGPTIQFQCDAIFCLTGANFDPILNDKPCPMWKPVFAEKGSVLKLSSCKEGARGYLHIKGGIQIEKVLNSYSTYLRAGIGGFQGRPLQKGDELPILQSKPHQKGKWSVQPKDWFPTNREVIRVVKGTEYDKFTEESKHLFVNNVYTISKDADRMGYRLEGANLFTKEKVNLLSEAVTFGTIQVPSNGKPIILMADRQTVGGYPKLAQVITSDLPKLAQLKPFEKVRFRFVSLQDAQKILIQQENALKQLQLMINN